MKVRICQTAPRLLDLDHNLDQVLSLIEEGREEGAELIVFPELALTGYFVSKEYHKVALRLDSEEVAGLVRATRGTAAVVGFIEESPSMDYYNSALVAADGRLLLACRKISLPNYGDFEERKIFSCGERVEVFRLRGYTVSVLICNDLWHPSLPYLAMTHRADIIVGIINSSEASMGEEFSNIHSWEIINKFYARIMGIYLISANRAGEEGVYSRAALPLSDEGGKPGRPDHEVNRYWGGSEIINPYGQRMAKAELYRPDTIEAELDRDLLRQKRILLPYLRQDDPYLTQRELDRILRERESGD